MVGDLEVRRTAGEVITHTARMTLCRCGLTLGQTFCDNSHRRWKWKSGPSTEPRQPPPPSRRRNTGAASQRVVIARDDAALEVRSGLHIHHSGGREMVDAGRVMLCRCGQRTNKPFCDSSHHRVGFQSRPPQTPRDRLEAETPAAFPANPRVPDLRVAAGG